MFDGDFVVAILLGLYRSHLPLLKSIVFRVQ